MDHFSVTLKYLGKKHQTRIKQDVYRTLPIIHICLWLWRSLYKP